MSEEFKKAKDKAEVGHSIIGSDFHSDQEELLKERSFKAGADWAYGWCQKEPVMVITDSPIISENITIDQRFRFEQQIKQLTQEVEVLIESLEKEQGLRGKLGMSTHLLVALQDSKAEKVSGA